MAMRFPALICCAVPLIAVGQTKRPGVVPQKLPPSVDRVTPPGQAGWKPSKMTLATLADRLAKATSELKNTKAQLHIDVTTPEGRAMFATPSVLLSVMNRTYYRVDFVAIQRVPFSCSMANDGKTRHVRMDKNVKRMPASTPLAAAQNVTGDKLVRLFDVDFPRLMFQGLTEGKDAWKPILTGWSKGVDGYKAIVEERTVVYQGNKFFNYRIRADRSAAAAKKLGTSTFEIIIDGNRFLPVTVRNVRKDENGKSWSAIWAAMYRFNERITAKDVMIG